MTVDGVIVENMQNYDTLLLKEGIFYGDKYLWYYRNYIQHSHQKVIFIFCNQKRLYPIAIYILTA